MTNSSSEHGDPLGPEARLALAYAPAAVREDLEAVWMLDARMRALGTGGGDAMLGQIKLAWWEEQLARLAVGEAPAEPLLRRVAGRVRGDEAGAAELAALAGAWRELGGEAASPEEIARYARLRGRAWIAASARILGGSADDALMTAGEGRAAGDLARRAADATSRATARSLACERFASAGRPRWPWALRPVGMIVELARRDSRAVASPREGSPRRVAAMARHALTGR